MLRFFVTSESICERNTHFPISREFHAKVLSHVIDIGINAICLEKVIAIKFQRGLPIQEIPASCEVEVT